MATAASVLQSFRASAHQQRVQLGWRDHFVTLLLAFWLMIGLFVDGWAHNNLGDELETFFTPWHALFYSGFLANSLWITWLLYRQWRAGKTGLAIVPQGYHLGVIGVVIFGAGGFGDMIWHIVFGIEQNIEALLSPTHLLIFLGGTMIFASPFAAAWASNDPAQDEPSFRTFLPTLGSITMMTSFVSFMNMYLWALMQTRFSQSFMDRITLGAGRAGERMTHFASEAGLGNILITTVILVAPLLLMLRRWRVPFGSATFLLTFNTILMSALIEFRAANIIVIALITGLVADGLITLLRPSFNRTWPLRVVAVATPLVLWTLRFLDVARTDGVAWPLELSAGITVMAALAGLGLSFLVAPPAVPARLAAPSEARTG